MRLNEWKPDFFDSLPDPIRVYHGTDFGTLDNILRSGRISAKEGHRHGETYGINWFSLRVGGYGMGTYFSIDIPKTDFDNYKFHFMNNSDLTSNDDVIRIDGYNLRIVTIGGGDEEYFRRAWDNTVGNGGDVFDFVNYLNRVNREFKEWQPTVDNPAVIYLIRQLFGDNELVKAGLLGESRKKLSEVKASDINMSPFKPKSELNPKLWVNGKINSRVRVRLLDIADDFMDELAIGDIKPEDIVLTGSLSNYNWSKYSDIDLHIVIDFSKVYPGKKDFVEDYFKTKREAWTESHGELKIYGYPVEVSVEDSKNPAMSTGVYSIVKNEWIVEPDDFDNAELNSAYIRKHSAKLMTKIDAMLSDYNNRKGLDNLDSKAYNLFMNLRRQRQESLSTSGEMGSGNIIYKILKHSGYLDKLWDVINGAFDRSMSMP